MFNNSITNNNSTGIKNTIITNPWHAWVVNILLADGDSIIHYKPVTNSDIFTNYYSKMMSYTEIFSNLCSWMNIRRKNHARKIIKKI